MPIGVRQIPVVLDTTVNAPFKGMTMEGVYQFVTESAAENHVDPVAVRADSTVNSVESDGCLLANGQAWGYFASANIGPQPAVGDHVVVYDQSLVDDTKPDDPLLQTTWIDGKSTGQLLLVTPGR